MSIAEHYLLERIERGWLHVDHATLDVHNYNPIHNRFTLKTVAWHVSKNGTSTVRARFTFNLNITGKHKVYSVFRNRLVWMYFNRLLVPADHVVEHKDGDCTNDHPSNLTLMCRIESDAQGYDRQTEPGYQECSAFFDHIAFTGETPNGN